MPAHHRVKSPLTISEMRTDVSGARARYAKRENAGFRRPFPNFSATFADKKSETTGTQITV
jgi:hypothetical protein